MLETRTCYLLINRTALFCISIDLLGAENIVVGILELGRQQ